MAAMEEFTVVARIELPIRVRPETNVRMHWAQRAKIASGQRSATKTATLIAMPDDILNGIVSGALDVCVVLVRYGKGMLDDDNLATAFKHVRDGVADALGLDDGSPRYMWEYMQVRWQEYKVEIEIGVKNHVPELYDRTLQQSGTRKRHVQKALQSGLAARRSPPTAKQKRRRNS